MKVLSITGGATKFIQLLIATHKILQHGYKPDDIVVKSSSAIYILPLLLGKYDQLYKEGVELDLAKYFTVPPTNGNGKLTPLALLRAAASFLPNWMPFGAVNSFGEQDVRPLLRKYLSLEEFNRYKYGDYPNVHVVTVVTGKKDVSRVVNLKELEYEEALANIEGSAQIQAFTAGLEIDGQVVFDGGMFTAGAAGYLFETGYFDIEPTELVSIYSWTKYNYDLKESDAWKENIANNSLRISNVFKAATKWAFPRHEYWYCRANNIKRLEVRCPDVFEHTYQYDKATVDKAVEETTKYMNQLLSNVTF